MSKRETESKLEQRVVRYIFVGHRGQMVWHRWLGIFVFSGWHSQNYTNPTPTVSMCALTRPMFTRLHELRGCIMHVCGDRREFKPTYPILYTFYRFHLLLQMHTYIYIYFQCLNYFPLYLIFYSFIIYIITSSECV